MRGYETKRPLFVRDLASEGVTAVTVRCSCGWSTDVPTERLPSGLTMTELAKRLSCHRCKGRPNAVEPAWHTREKRSN